MKKITYLISVLVILFLVAFIPKTEKVNQNSKKIEWLTFEQAIEKSKKQPRPIFVDVYTSWCGWCKRMDKATFQKPEVVDYMSKNFYCIKFNAEGKDSVVFPNKTYKNRGKNHDLAVELLDRRMSYPTVVYLDKTFRKIQAIPGYREPKEFLLISKYLGEGIYKSKSWEEYQKEHP